MSRHGRKAMRSPGKQEFDAAVKSVFPKEQSEQSPAWVNDLVDATHDFVDDAYGGVLSHRDAKIKAMCDIAERHLYSAQYNRCSCGWIPVDTPPVRQFLEHVMTDVVDRMKL